MDKISIIIPVYNGQKRIARCLDSIIKQDHRDLEIIVVDDGSSDDSLKIIQEYAQKDDRIIPVHKENGGVSSARNGGLDKATGDFIQFVDVDDWLPFDASKLLLRSIEENDADLAVGDFYRVIKGKTSKKGPFRKSRLLDRNEYAEKMMLSPADFYFGVIWNKLYKRSIIEKHHIRMDERIDYCEDTIFNLEYLLHVSSVYVLTTPVYYYHLTQGSLVSQNLNIQDTVKMKLEVIRYYVNFYRNIMDPQEYEQRKPIIYSYLFAFSKDGFNIPLLDQVRKLGDEGAGKVYVEDRNDRFVLNYLENSLLKKLLNTTGEQYGLGLEEMMILYYLYHRQQAVSFTQIMSVCALGYTEAARSLAKLVASSYISVNESKLIKERKMEYEYNSGKLDDALKQIDKDYENICFRDLSEEEIETYRRIDRRIINNIREMM